MSASVSRRARTYRDLPFARRPARATDVITLRQPTRKSRTRRRHEQAEYGPDVTYDRLPERDDRPRACRAATDAGRWSETVQQPGRFLARLRERRAGFSRATRREPSLVDEVSG